MELMMDLTRYQTLGSGPIKPLALVMICWGGRPPNGIEVCQNEVVADLN